MINIIFFEIQKIEITADDPMYIEDTEEWDHPFWTSLWYRCFLWGLKISCLDINLLTKHETESKIRGDAIEKIIRNSLIDDDLNKIATYNEPKNVLPESPINNLEGFQLNIKKADRTGNKTSKEVSIIK